VTKGKPWTVEEERKLRELFSKHVSVAEMAKALNKSREAVKQKIIHLELKEEEPPKLRGSSSSRLKIPKELPSIETALKDLIAALDALKESDLGSAEVLRLRSIIQGVKIYKELFADYVNYRGHEVEMVKMMERLAALEKVSKSDETE